MLPRKLTIIHNSPVGNIDPSILLLIHAIEMHFGHALTNFLKDHDCLLFLGFSLYLKLQQQMATPEKYLTLEIFIMYEP